MVKLLSRLPPGKRALIIGFSVKGATLIRFLEAGFHTNGLIQMLGKLPFGGNLIVLSKYGKYTLRKTEAQKIQIKEL